MSFKHGSKANVYLNGYDVSGYIRSVQQSSEMDTASVDVMGGQYKQSVTGLIGASLNIGGYIDNTATVGQDPVFGPAGAFQSTNYSYLIYAPQGSSDGAQAYGYAAWASSYEMTTDIGDAGQFTAAYQSDVGLERGIIAHHYANESAGGTKPSASTGYDLSAVYGSGYPWTAASTAYLLVGSAAASLAVTVSSSTSTNGSYTTLGTFTTTSTAYTCQRLSIASTTINQFLRCVWTGTGTFAVLFAKK